jgi:hypothetical protein
LDVKRAVDAAIGVCSETFDLHKAIEDAKLAADEAVDERQKRKESQKGLQHLRQYFELMIFQAYLNVTPADTWRDLETFEHFVKSRPGKKHQSNILTFTAVMLQCRHPRSMSSNTNYPIIACYYDLSPFP